MFEYSPKSFFCKITQPVRLVDGVKIAKMGFSEDAQL